MITEGEREDDEAGAMAQVGSGRHRRSLLRAAAGSMVLAASGLLLPDWLAETEAREGSLGGAKGGRRGNDHKGRHRRRTHGDKKDKPRGGSGTNDQDFVFVGSTTATKGPVGLAAGDGRLFVANAASNSNGVQLFGLGAKGQLTLQGSLYESFNIAVAVTLDAAGRLYVADLLGFVRVYAIHDDGGAHRVAEIRGVPRSNGVAVAGRFLYIASDSQNSVQTYRIVNGDPPTYEPVATVTGFNKPGHLAYDGGRLYVADTGNNRVQVYGVDGGSGEATFKRTIPVLNPGGVAVGGGRLYVSCSRPGDSSRSRVQVFDLDADGAATPAAVLTKGDRSFRDPRGVALGRGFLFVADGGNNRVQVFRIP